MITLEKIKLYHKNTIMLIKELKEEWYLLQIELMLLDIFKEKYEDDIFDKWYKIDDSGALKGPGDWKFEMHPKEPEKTCIM